MFALVFGIAVREGQRDHQTPNLAYTDDLKVWEGKPVGLSKSWDSLTTALSKARLEMKPSKCTTWRPHDPANSEPAIPRIKVDTANDPTTGRADKACKLARGVTDMARTMVDKCGAHPATFLLQRVVCPSLDNDVRARDDKHVATQQKSPRRRVSEPGRHRSAGA